MLVARLLVCSLVTTCPRHYRGVAGFRSVGRGCSMPPATRSTSSMTTLMGTSASHEGSRSKRLKREPGADVKPTAPATPMTGADKTTRARRPAVRVTVTPSNTDFSPSTVTEDSVSSSSPSAESNMSHSTPTRCKAPSGWQDVYSLVEELRQDRTAPCDQAGCEALAAAADDPKAFRFQALLSLMLSSQTKDATVGQAVRTMQAAGVCSAPVIAAMSPAELNGYINKVGFHNLKTKYIKETVDILLERYGGDIPPTAAEMQTLPGVGPKMAYICESVAWNRASGIGVDTHMHRLFNLLSWVQSKTPEQTRLQLEAWLPEDKWTTVNLLWVGFGQEVQQFRPKLLQKALDCSRPREALRLLKRCGLDYAKEAKKLGMEEEIKKVMGK